MIDRSEIENLALALNNARRIGAVLGIIMYSYKVSEEQAFTTLRIASQHVHRKLRDIAVTLTDACPLASIPVNHGQPSRGRAPPRMPCYRAHRLHARTFA